MSRTSFDPPDPPEEIYPRRGSVRGSFIVPEECPECDGAGCPTCQGTGMIEVEDCPDWDD